MGECEDCVCPKCNMPRFKGPHGRSGDNEPNICDFFYDVLEYFFHEMGLCKAITNAQQSLVLNCGDSTG